MISVVCLIFLFFIPCSLQAGQLPPSETLIVTGTGQIINDDDAGAREAAITESLVTAVGLVMAKIMPVDLLVSNFQTLNDTIYNTEQFINGYRVLTETKYKNRYRVIVEVRVSPHKIQKQLSAGGIIVDTQKAPKLLLLVAEQHLEDTVPSYWWQIDGQPFENKSEQVLEAELQKRGFIVVAHPGIPELPEEAGNLDTPEPDNDTALALAGKYNADLVIIGKASAIQTQNTMGEELRSFKGILDARALDSKTGEEIARTYRTNISLNADDIAGGLQAISIATALAGEDLSRQITEKIENAEKKITQIKISVKGTHYLGNFVKFRNALNSVPNVKNVLTREMKSDQSTIIVDYTGSTQALAQALMLKSFDTFGINISRLSENHLNIDLVNKTSRTSRN